MMTHTYLFSIAKIKESLLLIFFLLLYLELSSLGSFLRSLNFPQLPFLLHLLLFYLIVERSGYLRLRRVS